MMTSQAHPITTKTRSSARRTLLAAAAIVSLIFPQTSAAGGVVGLDFEDAVFTDPLDIDNDFFPLVVGTTTIFRAEGPDGCEEFHITVTNQTKTVAAGVTGRVVHETAYEGEDCDSLEIVEETDDWFAQDDAGNVWYLGEDSFDCDGGVCTPSAGSWEAGADIAGSGQNAVAGIIMLAEPDNGDQYYQEFYEGFAEDQGKVTGVGVKVILKSEDAISLDPDANCIKTKEWSQLSPGSVEQKYYCEDIGLVAVDEHHGKELRFELVTGAASSSSSDAFEFRTVPGTR